MFCWLGWHLWTKWTEPYRVQVYGDDGTIGYVMIQKRTCIECGKVNERWV